MISTLSPGAHLQNLKKNALYCVDFIFIFYFFYFFIFIFIIKFVFVE